MNLAVCVGDETFIQGKAAWRAVHRSGRRAGRAIQANLRVAIGWRQGPRLRQADSGSAPANINIKHELANTWGRILGCNWEKSHKSFPTYFLPSPPLRDFTPPSPLSKSGLKLLCNVNTVYGNLKSKNSQDYAQKPQRNCTFMNSASGFIDRYLVLSAKD